MEAPLDEPVRALTVADVAGLTPPPIDALTGKTLVSEGGAGWMRQTAPYPVVLDELVKALRYRRGWSFELADVDRGQGSAGLTLTITVRGQDGYDPDKPRGVAHLFIVPAASYNARSWTKWLYDRVRDVELHEENEFFRLSERVQVNGVDHWETYERRPFAPSHGPGNDPYFLYEVVPSSVRDAETAAWGEHFIGSYPKRVE